MRSFVGFYVSSLNVIKIGEAVLSCSFVFLIVSNG